MKSKNDTTSKPNTLIASLEEANKSGFTENFMIVDGELTTGSNGTSYKASEVVITNFHRFEGYTNPSDNAVLYFIETSDGRKGTVVDAYGAYADEGTSAFIKKVEEIQKKNS